MDYLDWEENMTTHLEEFREENMSAYRASQEYKDLCQKRSAANEKVRGMNLTEEQFQAVEEAIAATLAVDDSYISAAYVQGICDSLRFLKFLQKNK